MLVQNWIRKINLRNNEKSAEVYRTGTGTVTFTNQNCDIYAYYGKDFWMALEQSKSNTIIRTSVCSSHDCVKQNPILLMFRYDRIFQNLVLIMEMKWDTLHSFHQYRIILGRGVKSALLKGKNSVVDYLVTVVSRLCANNAVFPLQPRAFYPRCTYVQGKQQRWFYSDSILVIRITSVPLYINSHNTYVGYICTHLLVGEIWATTKCLVHAYTVHLVWYMGFDLVYLAWYMVWYIPYIWSGTWVYSTFNSVHMSLVYFLPYMKHFEVYFFTYKISQ